MGLIGVTTRTSYIPMLSQTDYPVSLASHYGLLFLSGQAGVPCVPCFYLLGINLSFKRHGAFFSGSGWFWRPVGRWIWVGGWIWRWTRYPDTEWLLGRGSARGVDAITAVLGQCVVRNSMLGGCWVEVLPVVRAVAGGV